MAIAIMYRDELKEYDFGAGHPFRGDRYSLFYRFLLENMSEDDNYRIVEAEYAADEDLLLICRQDYISFTREYYRAASLGLEYLGPFHRYHSGDNLPVAKPGRLEEAARLIVGQARTACDLIQDREFDKVVCIGGGLHHAKPSFGEGFCLYNDVAFAARYLLEKHGLKRILILDTDAHAGNGTSEYFYEDPRVLLIDMHQDPRTLYPGTGFSHQLGSGEGEGFTINIPLPPYAGCDSYQLVFESVVRPVACEFAPEIIIRNGGSDPHYRDGLTNLGLTVAGFKMIGENVGEIAAEICGKRVIDLITSGYNPAVLPQSWLALISGLAGWQLLPDEPETVPERFRLDNAYSDTERVVDEVKGNLKEYWKCFS